MIRPVRFSFNSETALTNSFQTAARSGLGAQENALREFDSMVELLMTNGLDVTVVEDTPSPHTPDSIFPNNWISMHADGTVCLYPMQAVNRRQERRQDIIETLIEKFVVNEVKDYTAHEVSNIFLEGTGSMVLDRENKICFACLSPRTHLDLLRQFCHDFGYSLVTFHALDRKYASIYHTNVVMCIASRFAVICFECIPAGKEQEHIREALQGKEIIEISLEQLENFAGNMLEVHNSEGEKIMVMSAQAHRSLTPDQIKAIEKYDGIIVTPLFTIEENGGGSARCMMAEVFLPLKSK